MSVFRDDREAQRAQLEAEIVRQERAVRAIEEARAQLAEIVHPDDHVDVPVADLATTDRDGARGLELEALFQATERARTRANALERDLDEIRRLCDLVKRRRTLTLVPPPRRVPALYVVAELLAWPWATWALLAGMALVLHVALWGHGGETPLAVAIGPIPVVVSIVLGFAARLPSRLRALRWGTVLNMGPSDAWGSVDIFSTNLRGQRVGNPIALGVVLVDSRNPDRVVPVGRMWCKPRSNPVGQWQRTLPSEVWPRIAATIAFLAIELALAPGYR